MDNSSCEGGGVCSNGGARDNSARIVVENLVLRTLVGVCNNLCGC